MSRRWSQQRKPLLTDPRENFSSRKWARDWMRSATPMMLEYSPKDGEMGHGVLICIQN